MYQETSLVLLQHQPSLTIKPLAKKRNKPEGKMYHQVKCLGINLK